MVEMVDMVDMEDMEDMANRVEMLETLASHSSPHLRLSKQFEKKLIWSCSNQTNLSYNW